MAQRARPATGMVTAEMAVGLLSVALLMVVMAWLAGVLALQVRCIDTAAEVARQAARDDLAAVERAKADGPRGAEVAVTTSGQTAQVRVRARARALIPALPEVPVHAEAEVLLEPGARR